MLPNYKTYEADPAKCRLVIKAKKGKAVNKKRCELLTAARCEWTKVEEVGLKTIDETDHADEENPFAVEVEEEAEDIEEPEGQAANTEE
ncbi:hypothetical protein CYMTET_8985, partial [Cymbomonas tetramitiformis]